jgi:deferrochelatase/peroxidase EfeB
MLTDLGASLTQGHESPGGSARDDADADETLGLGPARLTVNIGLGPSMFAPGSSDRFGLAKSRPIALVDLPPFPGDELEPGRTGGDLSVHVCADDAQVVFHAVRRITRSVAGAAAVRWSQSGFREAGASCGTPRNLMGFKDGTMNPSTAFALSEWVWVAVPVPAWMVGGTYVVVRRIRMDLDRWDDVTADEQEGIIGRHKVSGAPLGCAAEFDPLDLAARRSDGELRIPEDAHVRIASPSANWNNGMLRRSYSFAEDAVGASGALGESTGSMEAGLFFVAYQSWPRLAFIPIYGNLARRDALRHFTTHTGSTVAAIPPGAPAPGRWIGQQLFEG